MTEQQVLAAIEKVVAILAPKFKFGYYDVEDMKQEARYEAIKALSEERYDNKRPLENFLYTVVLSRLINLKRNKYKRSEPPCVGCPFYDKSRNKCAAFEDRMSCIKFANWTRRNANKQGLLYPVDISLIFDSQISKKSSVVKDVELREIIAIIERNLPKTLQVFWEKAKGGGKLRKTEREKLQRYIATIFEVRKNA